MPAAFASCTGTRPLNGPTCCTGLPVSRPLMRRGVILSMMSASATSGIPHSIQGLGPDGCEFLLVFDDGEFDEDNTFLLSDWFKHTPSEVLSKNFGVPADLFGDTPDP